MNVEWKNQNEDDFEIYRCLFENKYRPKIRADRFDREFVIKNMKLASKGNFTNLDSPVWVGVKLTNYCNLKCKHCWTVNHGYVPSIDNIKVMLDKLYTAHIKFVGLSGGELFTRQDILEILEYAKSKKMILELFSNATLITDEIIDKLDEILDKRVDVIQISLDGISEKSLLYQRGISDPVSIISVIEKLIKKGFMVRISYVVTSANVYDLMPTFALMDELGAKGFSVSAVYPKLKGIHEFEKLHMVEYYRELYKCVSMPYKLELEYFLQIDFFEHISYFIEKIDIASQTHMDFTSGFLSWFIDANGDVYPEFHMQYKELLGGNIYQDSIEDIRKTFADNKKLGNGRSLEQTECLHCPFKLLCLNHSYEQAYEKYKDFNKKNPYCKL